MESPSAVRVCKDEAARLYKAQVGGRVVGTLAYETAGGRVALTHSYVDEEHRHVGVASEMARFALADLRRSSAKVGVFCGFVADYVDEHPEWDDVVDIHRSALIATRFERDNPVGD